MVRVIERDLPPGGYRPRGCLPWAIRLGPDGKRKSPGARPGLFYRIMG